MPQCPKCGSEDTKPKKTWTMTNPKANTRTEVTLHFCRNCGKTFRTAKKLEA